MNPWERDAIIESARGGRDAAAAAPWEADPVVDGAPAGAPGEHRPSSSAARSTSGPLRLEVNGTADDERRRGGVFRDIGRQVGLTARHALSGAGT